MLKRACLLLLLGTAIAAAAPVDDLASPDQATRDAAAKILRAAYTHLSHAKWDQLLAMLKPGLNGKDMRALLKPYSPEGLASDGGVTTSSYRLDDVWVVTITTDDGEDGALMRLADISPRPRGVWARPPARFTGRWITYYVNGQKNNDIGFRNGALFGTNINYRADGTKQCVQHYDDTGCNGEEICYFPTGRISARGQYTHGTATGLWTWYNEDGSVDYTLNYNAIPSAHGS